MYLALWILACALPTVIMYFIIAMFGGWRRLAEWRRRPSPPPSLDRLEGQLRRLRAELERTETSSQHTAKQHHLQALRGAYADALAEACARLEVPPPAGGTSARRADVYRAEAALRERGLDVRETAAH